MRAPAKVSVLVVSSVAIALVLAGAASVPADRPVAGPIQAALGLDDSAVGAAALDRRRAAEVARRIDACMAALGVAYVARPEPPPPIPDSDLDPVAWAIRWGFGVSTSIGVTQAIEPAPPPATRAIRDALYGGPAGPGCHERARTEVYGLRDRHLAPLGPAFAALQAAIDDDPAMVGVLAAWRRCVGDATGSTSPERGSVGPAVLDDFAARAAATADEDALRRLQDEERRVATAMALCELAYQAGRDPVARGHELVFVRAHGTALAAAASAIRGAEAAYPPDPGP